MHVVFDIFQGIGIAVAIGIRPFVPSIAVGLLAAGGVELQFEHTEFAFLQHVPFLLVMVVLAALTVLFEYEPARRSLPWPRVLVACSLVLGALFFGAALAQDGHPPWPGYAGGVLCAAIAVAASRPFLERLRSRLDAGTAAVGVPVLADGSALLIAVASVLAPPLGLVALIAMVWLLVAGRRREASKYAGLRILR